MSRYFFLGAVLLIISNSRVEAANFAVITAPPTMLNLLILIFGFVCVGVAFRVHTVVRGGQLSRSWIFFMSAFALLVLSQLLSLLQAMEVMSLPGFVIPACLAVMAGLFLYGVLEIRKVLG
ncbi:MAG: hypothetical protein DRP47_01695 [Candidatus Zixiibacteriota bacterium]|nr:MAG: hypothetical protein DRP47_01695 [candidate division Zixibacteria bacterium]